MRVFKIKKVVFVLPWLCVWGRVLNPPKGGWRGEQEAEANTISCVVGSGGHSPGDEWWAAWSLAQPSEAVTPLCLM